MLSQQFHVKRTIRDSLYGSILLCEDQRKQPDDRLVAVKHISMVAAERARRLYQLAESPSQERRAVATLRRAGRHDNIVHYREGFFEQSSLFLVMDYCNGGDLQSFLAKNECPLSEKVALGLFKQVASGVQFLHQHGIAHRDLSLENVLLHDGTCKICDFGLSVSTETQCIEPVGKPNYRAPEVMTGVAYDPKQADLWSMGVILFMLLTDTPLFTSTSADIGYGEFANGGMTELLESRGMASAFSGPTVTLLSVLLCVDPNERMKVDDVVGHLALCVQD